MSKAAPFTISRVVDAPRALVYKVQTEAAHLEQWLSPEGFATIHSAMNFAVGGTYHYGLEGPGGMQMWGLQTFREIVPGEKIVFVQSFSNKDGGLTRHPMSPDWPLRMLSTTTFEDAGERKTRITITWAPYDSDEAGETAFDNARGSMQGGFGGTFAKLEAYLEQLQR
jgi:uncharacterized protein YndB with AHSA1/START domain